MKPLQIENCFQHTFIWVTGAFYFRQQQVMTMLLLYQCIKVITECAFFSASGAALLYEILTVK
jgi:virulence-associated protein VapD